MRTLGRGARKALALALCAGGALGALAPSALASAGGGSSGFGGGGGGGFGGGGGGYYGGGGAVGGSPASFGIVVAVIVGIFVLIFIAHVVSSVRYGRRRRHRLRLTRLAAREAAEDDAAFDPDTVTRQAVGLFSAIQQAWDAGDTDRLSQLVGPELMTEWKRRLADFERKGWHNRVQVLGDVGVEYCGLTNRESDDEDRVVVRVSARMKDYVEDRSGRHIQRKGSNSDVTHLDEYWTLGKREGRWTLLSIESDTEGRHQLDEALVASPWSDDQRLRDQAVVEEAVADKALDGYTPADLAVVDFDTDARAAALDLSLADGRFAPDVLEAAARRAVAGWAEAIDGEDAPLEAVASPDAVQALLHPRGQGTRLVVRGPRIRSVRIVGLETDAQPARMTIECEIRGRRYVEDRDTAAVLSGSKSSETTFTERWALALDGPDDAPWRIVDAAVPARS